MIKAQQRKTGTERDQVIEMNRDKSKEKEHDGSVT